jgi:hypothetical protein
VNAGVVPTRFATATSVPPRDGIQTARLQRIAEDVGLCGHETLMPTTEPIA